MKDNNNKNIFYMLDWIEVSYESLIHNNYSLNFLNKLYNYWNK